MAQYDIKSIRKEIIGNDILFNTPFGERHLLYTDYTASGRGHQSIEHKILNIQKTYANTHTSDDYSGQYSTALLHKAEKRIKQIVNAGDSGKIIAAGSNITGIRTKVYDIARICHQYQTFVFFDFAAVAPYVEINMNRDDKAYFDAIFFSPHKFLGGPGSSGILVFNEKIYRKDLPPTTAGGGTVIYVGFKVHDFSSDIETRE